MLGAGWVDIAYGTDASRKGGPGTLVAIQNNSETFAFMYNASGTTWTRGLMPFNTDTATSITFAGDGLNTGKFVVAATGRSTLFSLSLSDLTPSGMAAGAIWNKDPITVLTASEDFSAEKIVYSRGSFLVCFPVGTTNNFYYKDYRKVIGWSKGKLPSAQFWGDITSGKVGGVDMFVAVARNSNVYVTSIDGVTWTERTLPLSTQLRASVAIGNGIIMIYGAGKFLSSTNGTTWTVGYGTGGTGYYDAAFGANTFVGVSYSAGSSKNTTNGIINSTTPFDGGQVSGTGIIFAENRFVVVGYDNDVVNYSPTGAKWTAGKI